MLKGTMRHGLLGGLLLLRVLAAQDQHHHDGGLGQAHFAVSCTPAAQKGFERGVALLHSFWYDEAQRTFAETARADGSCAMAYWGIAMSLYHPLWTPPTPADLAQGWAAIEKAKSAGAPTQRERDYIAALELFYKDSDRTPHHDRAVAWRNGMRELAARYPADREAAIFFALAILGTASPSDKTYADQKQAAEILNRILPEQPDHPGIAHYLIHSFDSPQLAELALPAARSYARIAPDAPHALHMPSHIFTRLGMWPESIESNLASATAAKRVARMAAGGASQDQLHAMDYLVYAYLQTCQDGDAMRLARETVSVSKVDQTVFQAAYALAAIPARYALERRRWTEAGALAPRPAGFPWERFRYAEAITYFARAVGSARSGDVPAARAAIGKLAEIEAALPRRPGEYDWKSQVEAQRLSASAWLRHAEGDNATALKWMRAAADLEAQTEKHPVTPGAILPAREMLGDLFMELNQPALALPEFEGVLRVAPGRFNATYGAGRAAELSGNTETARKHYADLVQLCRKADTERLELQNARTFLERTKRN